MKAVVLHEFGGPSKLKYEDFPDPEMGPDELLIRVAATSVNPIDYKIRSGAAQAIFPVQFPAILGVDISGTVRGVGKDVSAFKPGDQVMVMGWSAYAELAVVKAEKVALVPENLKLAEAGALPLVLLTGEQLISNGTGIGKGQTVLISGAVGGVGRAAVWTAKKAGAVVIAGVRKSQLEDAATLGADQVLPLDDKDAMAKLGFMDAVADAVGGETAERLMGKVKQGGVFATVTGPPENAAMHPTVRVAMVQAKPDAVKLRELAEDVVAGRLKIPIDRMIALEDAAEGHAAAQKGGIGKVVLLA